MKQCFLPFLLIFLVISSLKSQHDTGMFNSEISEIDIAKQQNYKSVLSLSSIKILGTSSLHDWESNVTKFKAIASKNGDIISAHLVVDVASIKSRNKLMDKKTHKALMLESYPFIILNSDRLQVENEIISGVGTLTIAATSRTIPISLHIESQDEQNMILSSNIPVKMTDYGIKPPKVLFGTIRTDDDITIDFTLKLIKI